jgi:hypothetical protein
LLIRYWPDGWHGSFIAKQALCQLGKGVIRCFYSIDSTSIAPAPEVFVAMGNGFHQLFLKRHKQLIFMKVSDAQVLPNATLALPYRGK